MLTSEELDALRTAIPGDPDLTLLLRTLQARTSALLGSSPSVPRVKALLSRDGGFCPNDGASLRFDPWSPERHTCPRCGEVFSGDRHHRNWARAQHLWLAERIADLALVAAVTDDHPAAARAAELLETYEELYFALPNRDNVLGPSHLFFSTYLESLWITSYLAGAFVLRERGLLSEERIEGVNRVADEAAGLIGEFNEGLSNRQTWHAAALTAVAAWFGDEELAGTAVESRTGLLGHLADGFGEDGLWWEGENYHLFALRGLMQGLHWSRAIGYDLLDDPEVRAHFRAALLAPTLSALPDFTYPARRDSRYGVSLAQPASLELWEIGRAWLGGDDKLDAWLDALYAIPLPLSPPLPPAEQYDAWLHDAGRPSPERRFRSDLSWWALTAMGLGPAETPVWKPESVLLASQGLAVLRRDDRYASLECGPEIGGHGHPDRLHLTLHAGGVHWLPDPGTGSYVHPTLAWYRSALAHNAPRLDGVNAGGEDAWCEAFDYEGEWAWCRGRAGETTRTIIAGPTHLVDVLEIQAPDQRTVDLPWHFQGELRVESPGHWEPLTLEYPFVTGARRFAPSGDGPLTVSVGPQGNGRSIRGFFLAPDAELIQADAPGLPTETESQPFLLLRGTGRSVRWVTVIDLAPAGGNDSVTGARAAPELIEVVTAGGGFRYHLAPAGVRVEHGAGSISLAGIRPAPRKHRPFLEDRAPPGAVAFAPRSLAAPALDSTLEGFDTSAPLTLDNEHQYRRSEEAYDPERFSARAWVNWDGDALYLGVSVSKPEVIFRPVDAPPLDLDNEPEDINSDGLQIYLRPGAEAAGTLVVPQTGGTLHARGIGNTRGGLLVHGGWSPTDDGYLVTMRLEDPRLALVGPGGQIGFDLLVNEMQPGRLRRAGQLVWSGGEGWIYLRGDRQDPSQLGILELG